MVIKYPVCSILRCQPSVTASRARGTGSTSEESHDITCNAASNAFGKGDVDEESHDYSYNAQKLRLLLLLVLLLIPL